jgi:hypothetical protein
LSICHVLSFKRLLYTSSFVSFFLSLLSSFPVLSVNTLTVVPGLCCLFKCDHTKKRQILLVNSKSSVMCDHQHVKAIKRRLKT